MHKQLPKLIMLSLAGWLAFSPLAHADESMFEIDSKNRAKIAKEKVKQGALQRKAEQAGKTGGADSGQCGSQNIGNVDTGGRVGAAPREVFVFAPNAINLVNGSGCR